MIAVATDAPASPGRPRLSYDRNELAGAFGDIGTDLPLIVGMILAAGLDAAGVLILFGAMQIFSGWYYRLPMPVQPLKAVAVIVITQHIPGGVLAAGGLAVGAIMLVLSVTGLVDWLGRTVPRSVVRGVQLGLGLKLATLALHDYLPRDGVPGYALGAAGFAICLLLYGNRRYPAALMVVLLGVVYAGCFKLDPAMLSGSAGLSLPHPAVPSTADWLPGLVLLALPQVPLSIGNSILAARQTIRDLFPDRDIGLRRISLTYSLMNLVSPWFGGIPTCHGSGGLAGHYAFGARTGGSVILYGGMFLALGLFFSGGFEHIVQIFPMPLLGVILLFEALALIVLTRDVAGSRHDLFIAVLTGLLAASLPYGFLVGMVVGTVLAIALPRTWFQSGR